MSDSEGTGHGDNTGVILQLRHSVANPLLMFLKPEVSVDNLAPSTLDWGESVTRLEPGAHTMTCEVKWRKTKVVHPSTIAFVVPEDGLVSLEWRTPVPPAHRGKWTYLGTT